MPSGDATSRTFGQIVREARLERHLSMGQLAAAVERSTASVRRWERNDGLPTPEVIEQLKATGDPIVLTVNGKAEIVVQDAASYQRMLELVHSAEAIIGIKKGLDSMARGEGIPAEEAFERLRKKHDIPQDA